MGVDTTRGQSQKSVTVSCVQGWEIKLKGTILCGKYKALMKYSF